MSSTSTSTKPFDDLMSTLPNIKNCDTDKTKCTCVDPSYNYSQPCTPHAFGSDKRTTHCTFGKPGTGYENSGNLPANKYNYTVGTTTGRANFAKEKTAFQTQPKSLLFCSDPIGTGGTGGTALPTLTKSQITGSDGTVEPDTWDTDNNGTEKQTNLGFDR